MEDVINLHTAYIRQDRAMDTLKKINPELLKDESNILTLESLISGNSKLSDKDLEDYATKLYGKSDKKVDQKKQPKTSGKTSQPASTETTNSQKRVISGGNFDFFK